uniref:Receptor-like serine/threonine-protein kinase n=1 Tax=Ananas comosus var. bracteatus TaxID=296719 RepID=A0A6V7PPQ6_ANACO|nr:unnamed protein product [Ananas comosus var. bracteatus]
MKQWPPPLPPLLLLLLLSLSSADDTLSPDTPLADGNSTLNIGVQTIVWVANREDPIADRTGLLKIGGGDGNLILSNQSSYVFWSTNTSSAGGGAAKPVAQLLDTGNFVLKADAGDSDGFLWQSFDYPTDTLLPGMKLGWDFRRGLDRALTTWKSPDDPSAGDYTFKVDPHGSPQVLIWDRSAIEYRNGPWNGVQFSGEPEMQPNSVFAFHFINDDDEMYYMYQVTDNSVVSRFVMNQSMIQRYVWFDSRVEWSLYWSMPRDQCDYYGQCGHFGVCNSNDSPICECLQGFEPKDLSAWNMRDGSGGCVRRTDLDCRSDGFLRMSKVKLPDTANSTVNATMSLEECRESCLKNCSCTAYSSSNISEGDSGCIIWADELMDIRQYVDGGQDLYVRLAASDLQLGGEDESKNKQVMVIIVISIASGLLLLGSGGFCIWNRMRKRSRGNIRSGLRLVSFDSVTALGPTQGHFSEENSREKELQLPVYDISTIVAATENFSASNKIGEGGFGTVYKGELEEGHTVAVKRLSKYSLQGLDEFKNEVMLIAKLQHVNLVRLLGCCIHGEERMLIYEYMRNKSLNTIIFDKTRSPQLTWPKRFNIIIGIARGLLYLHQDSRFRIIHRDLKASNILLDEELNPKISDFGLARIFGGDQTDAYTKKVVGTYGYMSPEYAMDGIFSVKSDVFSFGVLVLEIVSGKKNRGIYSTEPQLNLLGHAWRLWKEGNLMELIDGSMSLCNVSEALRCMQVGLLCVQERAEERPHMSTVILMLGSASAMLPQPKQPGYCSDRSTTDTEWSSSCTANDVTVTIVEGR